MSIIDNLITDRNQSDVDALRALLARGRANWTAEELAEFNLARSKGAYNYTDLNRVTEAMEYLDESLRGYGYETNYRKLSIPHNPKAEGEATKLLIHGTGLKDVSQHSVSLSTSGVSVSDERGAVNEKSLYFDGTGSIIADILTSGDLTIDFWVYPIRTNMYPFLFEYQQSGTWGTLIQGDNYGTTYQFGAQNSAHNYISAESFSDIPDEVWSHIAVVRSGTTCTVYVNGTKIRELTDCRTDNSRIRFGAALHGESPTYYFKGYMDEIHVVDRAIWLGDFTPLSFPYIGAQDSFDPYTWYYFDVPTTSQMSSYLSNVEAIRSVLEVLPTTPETPESMELLTWAEANNIEQILVDVETVITSMSQIFLRAGTSWANSGGPNFYFAN